MEENNHNGRWSNAVPPRDLQRQQEYSTSVKHENFIVPHISVVVIPYLNNLSMSRSFYLMAK